MKKIFLIFAALFMLSSCAKKELAVGDAVSKKIYGDKLKLVVLSVSEHDENGNIIHKKTGKYRDTVSNSFLEQYKRNNTFAPVVYDKKDVYYNNEYDESGNLIHCVIQKEDVKDAEYVFKYDGNGKVIYSKATISGGDYECYYGNL